MNTHVMQIIVDETAQESLAFLQRLQSLGEVERPAEGIYIVDGPENLIMKLTDQFPNAVIKAETV